MPMPTPTPNRRRDSLPAGVEESRGHAGHAKAGALRRRGTALARRLAADPRHYQLLVLGSLLAWGVFRLDLEVRAGQALAIVAAALATQLACTRLAARRPAGSAGAAAAGAAGAAGTAWATGAAGTAGATGAAGTARAAGAAGTARPAGAAPPLRFDPKSAGISALSLCLLLRTDRPWLAVAAAVLSIASKFLLRVRGKHLWNPTNFGLVAMMIASRGQVWVSPGQWGSAALFGFLVLCLGGLVVNRAARADVTWAFLGSYGALLLGRAWWLGQPAAIPLHQAASGAFLIFTFFMISDPKTTPDSRAGRLLFALLVAAGAAWAQFALYRPTALLLSLACLAPLVPLLDRLLPGATYRWPRPALLPPERSFA